MVIFSVLWVAVVISSSFAESNSTLGESENAPNNEPLASPEMNMSPFLSAFYNALSSEKIFDTIFDVTFSPKDVGPAFYKNSFFFARQLGVKHPGPFSARVATATENAFKKKITPLQYFKVFGNTMQSFFSESGLAKKYDQEQVIQGFVKNLKKALESVGGSGPKAALKALAIGSINMFKILGKFKPDQINSVLVTFTKEMQKIR